MSKKDKEKLKELEEIADLAMKFLTIGGRCGNCNHLYVSGYICTNCGDDKPYKPVENRI